MMYLPYDYRKQLEQTIDNCGTLCFVHYLDVNNKHCFLDITRLVYDSLIDYAEGIPILNELTFHINEYHVILDIVIFNRRLVTYDTRVTYSDLTPFETNNILTDYRYNTEFDPNFLSPPRDINIKF